MAIYSKPYLTFEEQVDLLEERGLVLERTAALAAVSRIGYYRLSGYWYPYREMDAVRSAAEGRPVRRDTVVPGTAFEQVVGLYDFDRRLKLLVMDAIERIEVAVRVELAYSLGAVDRFAHRDAATFDPMFSVRRPNKPRGESAHAEWLRRLDGAASRSKEEFVAHFKKSYGGDLPIWVAVELTDFGMMSTLYRYARRPARDSIAGTFAVVDASGRGNGAALANWLRVLNFTRNTCAHHARLWNRNFTDQVGTRALLDIPELAHVAGLSGTDKARLYPALAVVRHLMATVAPRSRWPAALVGLLDTFPDDGVVGLADMGIPADWRTLLA